MSRASCARRARAAGQLRREPRAQIRELACLGRRIELRGAQLARALVALRRLSRDAGFERLDFLANGLELRVALASALRERERGTERGDDR